MWQFRGMERTTMEGRTMATGNASLLNSAMASSVSILVNVYVFTWPLCRRYSFACAQELTPSQQCFTNQRPATLGSPKHSPRHCIHFLDLWSFSRESPHSKAELCLWRQPHSVLSIHGARHGLLQLRVGGRVARVQPCLEHQQQHRAISDCLRDFRGVRRLTLRSASSAGSAASSAMMSACATGRPSTENGYCRSSTCTLRPRWQLT